MKDYGLEYPEYITVGTTEIACGEQIRRACIDASSMRQESCGFSHVRFNLTDGKNYVMENPMKVGEYLRTTSPVQAKELTYKQARGLLKSTSKKTSWIKSFQMINSDTGEIQNESDLPRYSNEGVFCGENSIDFDMSMIDTIKKEISSIIGLAAWDINQLNSYLAIINQGLQYYDSAISDVKHARLDKRPPANIRTKIDGILNELEEIRRDIKQTRSYIDVLVLAIKNQWTIGKIKAELCNAKYVPYKGRTKYFDMVKDLVNKY